MDSNNKEKNEKFPKSAIIVIICCFCNSIVYLCVTSVLALFLVDILQFEQSESVSFVHIYTIITAASSILAGILADSWLGKFTSLIFFSFITLCGLLLLILSSVIVLSQLALTALILVSSGYGLSTPCIMALGGDQFVLPQQKKQLSLFLVFIFMGGGVIGAINLFIIPILRKDLTCFQQLTCYPLVFLVPTVALTFGIVMLLLTKRIISIRKSDGNVAFDIVKCASYAVFQKFKYRDQHQHWLDYASDKFDMKLIEDIKSASRVLSLYLPMPMFWALYSMKNSTWTFQASRMDGDFYGYLIKPDQIQAVIPVSIVILTPILHIYIFPVLEKYLFLRTPLRKVTAGGLIVAFAYVCSGVLELKLEPTYAKIPTARTAQLRIFNTLNCNVSMVIDGQILVLEKLNMWQNLSITANEQKYLKYSADFYDCESFGLDENVTQGELEVTENQATSWAITNEGLTYNFIDTVDKSVSGDPLVRALIYIDENFEKENATLKFVHNDDVLGEITVSKFFGETKLIDMIHKKYDLYLNDQLVESNWPISVGGVYTILGHVSNSTVVARAVTVTQPNSVHIFWILPQELLLGVGMIMVEMLMTEFVFSQAPPNMKTLLQSFWTFSAVFGNLIVIAFTHFNPINQRAYQMFLYTMLMVISMIFFAILAYFYKYKEYSSNNEDEEND